MKKIEIQNSKERAINYINDENTECFVLIVKQKNDDGVYIKHNMNFVEFVYSIHHAIENELEDAPKELLPKLEKLFKSVIEKTFEDLRRKK